MSTNYKYKKFKYPHHTIWLFETPEQARDFLCIKKNELVVTRGIYRKPGDGDRFYVVNTKTERICFKFFRNHTTICLSFYNKMGSSASFESIFEEVDTDLKKILVLHLDLFT